VAYYNANNVTPKLPPTSVLLIIMYISWIAMNLIKPMMNVLTLAEKNAKCIFLFICNAIATHNCYVPLLRLTHGIRKYHYSDINSETRSHNRQNFKILYNCLWVSLRRFQTRRLCSVEWLDDKRTVNSWGFRIKFVT
jgi:hypothetical protein